MDIKDLNKSQLILLTLLITFIVSIATGIVTVSLMQSMPKSVPQTINRVIQQTIEKVTTVQAPADTTKKTDINFSDSAVVASIYTKNYVPAPVETKNADGTTNVTDPVKPLGQGVIISDAGLILVEGTVLTDKEDTYTVVLDKTLFAAKILKKFDNGFVILQISALTTKDTTTGTGGKDDTKNPDTGTTAGTATSVDTTH